MATGFPGDGSQGPFIQVTGGIDLSRAKETALKLYFCTNANGVDHNAFPGSDVGRFQRFNPAGRIGTIRQQNQDPMIFGTRLQTFHRQTNGITNGSAVARKANLSFIE